MHLRYIRTLFLDGDDGDWWLSVREFLSYVWIIEEKQVGTHQHHQDEQERYHHEFFIHANVNEISSKTLSINISFSTENESFDLAYNANAFLKYT